MIYISILSIGLLIYSLAHLLTFLCSLIYYLLTYLMCSAFPIVSRTWEPATSRLFFRCGWWAIRRYVTLDLEELSQNGEKNHAKHFFQIFDFDQHLIPRSEQHGGPWPYQQTHCLPPAMEPPWSTGGFVEISIWANAGCAGGDLEVKGGKKWRHWSLRSMVIQWWFHGVLSELDGGYDYNWLWNGVLNGDLRSFWEFLDVEHHQFWKGYGPWLPWLP